jgi:hypothetical protein
LAAFVDIKERCERRAYIPVIQASDKKKKLEAHRVDRKIRSHCHLVKAMHQPVHYGSSQCGVFVFDIFHSC